MLDKADPMLKTKLDLINETEIMHRPFNIFSNLTLKATYNLISWMRYQVFDDEDQLAFLHLAKDQEIKHEMNKLRDKGDQEALAKFNKDNIFKALSLKPISFDNERKAIAKLASIMLGALAKFDTTI